MYLLCQLFIVLTRDHAWTTVGHQLREGGGGRGKHGGRKEGEGTGVRNLLLGWLPLPHVGLPAALPLWPGCRLREGAREGGREGMREGRDLNKIPSTQTRHCTCNCQLHDCTPLLTSMYLLSLCSQLMATPSRSCSNLAVSGLSSCSARVSDIHSF